MQPGDEVPDDPLQDLHGGGATALRLAGPGARRHVRVHAMSAARLLPADGSAVRRAVSAPSRRTRRCDRVHLSRSASIPAHDTPAVIEAHAEAARRRPADVELPDRLAAGDRALSPRAFGVSTIARARTAADDHPQPAHRRRRSPGAAGEDPLGQRMDRRRAARGSARGQWTVAAAALLGVHARRTAHHPATAGRRRRCRRFLNAAVQHGAAARRRHAAQLPRRRPRTGRRTAWRRRSRRR